MTRAAVDEAFHRLDVGAQRSGRSVADLDIWWYVPTNVQEYSTVAIEESERFGIAGDPVRSPTGSWC